MGIRVIFLLPTLAMGYNRDANCPYGDPAMIRRFGLLLLTASFLFMSADAYSQSVNVSTPMSPPAWALLERQLLDANAQACREYFAKYFDERGWLLCVERWGGDDGPDDAIENCTDWPIL